VTYPFATPVQWIRRTKNSGGTAYAGTEWTEAAAVATAAVFAPGGSTELTQGGDTVTTQPTLYGLDATLGVSAFDKFIVNGQPYEGDGDPQDGYQSPFTGWAPGVVVKLKKVTG